MKTLKLFLVILILPFLSYAQAWQWVSSGGGSNFDMSGNSCISIDGGGNTYITGTFYNTFSIDTIQLNSSSGAWDIFWAKLDKNGRVVWAKNINSNASPGGIAVNNVGEVHVFMSFNNIISNNDFQVSGSGIQGNDLLLIKYDSLGNYISHKNWGSAYADIASNIVIDKNDKIYLYGTFAEYNGTIRPHDSLMTLRFDSIFKIISLNNYGGDFFVAILDSSLSTLKTKGIIGGGNATKISVDKEDNFVISGRTANRIQFDNIVLSHSNLELFIAKYDSSGNALWAHMAKAYSMGDYNISCASGSDGSVYCTGTYDASSVGGVSAIDFGGPHYLHDDNAFIIKFDPNGTIVWAKNIGVTARDAAYDIAIDSADNIYVTGTFDWWGKFGNDTIYTKGADDIYVNKYDKNGNYIWTATAGGATNDGGYAITVGADQNIYVGGYISSVPASFGSHQVSSNGAWDMCVAKLSPTPTTVKEVTAKTNDIRIAPNPNNGSFSVFIKQGNYQTLQLVDVMGKVMHEQNVPANQQGIITINAKLSSGLYFLKLSGKEGVVSKKMMVE